VELAEAIERLARKIAGDNADAMTLAEARAAARAQFDRTRIRQVRVALIEMMSGVGQFESGRHVETRGKGKQLRDRSKPGTGTPSETVEASAPMPATELERTAEAIRRALPELLKLDRYERRATFLRNQNILSVLGRNMERNDP
jgi:hypothetical protein